MLIICKPYYNWIAGVAPAAQGRSFRPRGLTKPVTVRVRMEPTMRVRRVRGRVPRRRTSIHGGPDQNLPLNTVPISLAVAGVPMGGRLLTKAEAEVSMPCRFSWAEDCWGTPSPGRGSRATVS